MSGRAGFYGPALAAIHHEGFGGFAAGAAPELLRRLDAAGLRGGLVVDLGCGSGIWARALTDAGYRVLGVDVSSAMIAIARTVAPAAAFRVGGLDEIDLPRCAAVTALGEPLSYLGPEGAPESPPLAVRFARVARALEPGGLLIFDLVEAAGEPMRYTRTVEGESDAGPWSAEVEVAEQPERALLTRRITTRRAGSDSVEFHRVRTFLRDDVAAALATAGLPLVETATAYGSQPLGPRRLAFFARRVPNPT